MTSFRRGRPRAPHATPRPPQTRQRRTHHARARETPTHETPRVRLATPAPPRRRQRRGHPPPPPLHATPSTTAPPTADQAPRHPHGQGQALAHPPPARAPSSPSPLRCGQGCGDGCDSTRAARSGRTAGAHTRARWTARARDGPPPPDQPAKQRGTAPTAAGASARRAPATAPPPLRRPPATAHPHATTPQTSQVAAREPTQARRMPPPDQPRCYQRRRGPANTPQSQPRAQAPPAARPPRAQGGPELHHDARPPHRSTD